MTGQTELSTLLRQMEPVLAAEPYGYACVGALPEGLVPFALVAEAEGLTVVALQAALRDAGVATADDWARISLTIHSDLAAVGLTAAIAAALTAQGISANVIAGYYHDHVFVQWARREDAMAALQGLAHG